MRKSETQGKAHREKTEAGKLGCREVEVISNFAILFYYQYPGSSIQQPASSIGIQLKLLRRKGDHLIDFSGIGKQHHQTIDSQGIAGRSGHVGQGA